MFLLLHSADSGWESMVGRHFLTLRDYDEHEVKQLLWTAADLKTRILTNEEIYKPLVNKSAGLIFEKRSTRTRISSETGRLKKLKILSPKISSCVDRFVLRMEKFFSNVLI